MSLNLEKLFLKLVFCNAQVYKKHFALTPTPVNSDKSLNDHIKCMIEKSR